LVKYRIHEGAWGCTATDLWLYGQAGQNLVRESITVFSDRKLREDFRQNIASVLKFVVFEYFSKTRAQDGCLSRHKSVPFFFSLKKQFNSLKGSELYRIAIVSWGWTGLRLAWWLATKFDLKAVIFPIFSKFASEFRSFFERHRQNPRA